MTGLFERLATRAVGGTPAHEAPARPQLSPTFLLSHGEGREPVAPSRSTDSTPRTAPEPHTPRTSRPSVVPDQPPVTAPAREGAPEPPAVPVEPAAPVRVVSVRDVVRRAAEQPAPVEPGPPRTEAARPLTSPPEAAPPRVVPSEPRAVPGPPLTTTEHLVERVVVQPPTEPGGTATPALSGRPAPEPAPVARPVRPPAALAAVPLPTSVQAAVAQTEPAVEIHIGRVDVRATVVPAPATPIEQPHARVGEERTLSLTSFLRGDSA